MKRFWTLLLLGLWFPCLAGEVIPPRPPQYFNDFAHVVSADTADRLNQTLEDFERSSSDQILVAVFPKMQSDSSIADYTLRVARAWKVGQGNKNNGAVLFVFVQDHKIFIQVGYGLKGALPDAICKRIIDEQIAPRFKAGDFNGGLSAGVNAILAAAHGEYHGTGRTVAETQVHGQAIGGFIFVLLVVLVLMVIFSRSGLLGLAGSSWLYSSSGSSGWSGGGGGFSGGFSGGGFSGGGGSFGGGGAGGSW